MPYKQPPAKRLPLSDRARSVLRDGMAAIGFDRESGNKLADWFDAQDEVSVTVEGYLPQSLGTMVEGAADEVPMPSLRPEPE